MPLCVDILVNTFPVAVLLKVNNLNSKRGLNGLTPYEITE